jgi:formylmethanofuran dehydrogenase subunit E
MSKFEDDKKSKFAKNTEGASDADTGHGTVTSVQNIKMEQKETFGAKPGSADVGYSTGNTGQRICNRCGETFLSDGDADNHVKKSHRPVSEIEAEEKKRVEEVKAAREERIAERKERLK